MDWIRARCQLTWCFGKCITIDEMMIRYNKTYSPISQYMPNKPKKWRLKVWCFVDFVSNTCGILKSIMGMKIQFDVESSSYR